MPTGVYRRTGRHREAVALGKRKAEAARLNGGTPASRSRVLETLASFASEQIAEAVKGAGKSGDFSLAHAWLDISELISKSE